MSKRTGLTSEEISSRIKIRRMKKKEPVPKWMEDAFNRDAPYEELVPGVKNPRVTREDLEYYNTHIRPSTHYYGAFYTNPKTGNEELIGFAAGGLKRQKFQISAEGPKKTALQHRLFPISGWYVMPTFRRKYGVGKKLLYNLMRAGMRENFSVGETQNKRIIKRRRKYDGIVLSSMLPETQEWARSRKAMVDSREGRVRSDGSLRPPSKTSLNIVQGEIVTFEGEEVKVPGKSGSETFRATNVIVKVGRNKIRRPSTIQKTRNKPRK